MTAVAIANQTGFPWSGTDRGATPEAQAIPRKVTALAESFLAAEHGSCVRQSREALAEAVEECSVPDWDGYGAAPANPMSASWAERIVGAFPASLGLGVPHFSFDPEGDALIEWMVRRDRMLTLSVGADGEIRYAARISGFKRTGIEIYADTLPQDLVETARRLVA